MTSGPGLVGAVEAADFRALMSGFPTGVGIVTTFGVAGQVHGMTCSSICSVSVDPPTLLICLRDGSPTLAAMLSSETFAVNLLHEDGKPAAELFASGDPDRFDQLTWRTGISGPHLIDAAHAIADCRLVRHERIGSHIVLFGEVVNVSEPAGSSRPLLYGRRRYATWPLSS